jgi:hypothetical protein
VHEVVAADGKAVAVAAEDEDVKVVVAEADAGGEGQGAAVDEMAAVAVDEVGETRRAADAGKGDDVLVRVLELLEHAVERREHGEVTAAGTPGGVVGGERLLGEGGARRRGRSCNSGRHG